LRIKVSGRVQGVFFRQNMKGRAKKLGLVGWVRNEDDGTVLILAEGPQGKLEELYTWLKVNGPPFAKIDAIEVQWGEGTGDFKDFAIRQHII